MADDKQGRDDQAHDEANRQRTREIEAARERGDEPEPEVDAEDPSALEAALRSLEYPATGAAIVATVGDREVAGGDGPRRVAELIADDNAESFASPTAVTERVKRPAVARAMKRVVEASSDLPEGRLRGSQREAYAKTFTALVAIDTVDDDEPVEAVVDWVVERIDGTDKLPGSRAVRRQAAAHCRENDYRVRNDEWLGI